MLWPPRLEPGDTIMFVAPAADLEEKRMLLAKERLEERGYRVDLSWAQPGADGRFDAVFTRRGAARPAGAGGRWPAEAEERPFRDCANDPLHGKLAARLAASQPHSPNLVPPGEHSGFGFQDTAYPIVGRGR